MAKITYTNKDSFGQPPQNMVYDTDMNQIKDGVNALYGNVVTAIPEADATKAGERFWLNGTEWVYAYAGQFGSLAAGTPWPVKGYKEYVSLLTQVGTDAPTVIELINTIGTITLSRSGVGTYQVASSGLFTSEKSAVMFGADNLFNSSLGTPSRKEINSFSANQLEFTTIRKDNGVLADGCLSSTKISIEVYP